MRQVIMIAVVLFLLGTCAQAAPAYGTKMPRQKEFFFGLQHYEIFDRDLNKDNGDLKSRQEHFLLTYGVTDWFSLDLKASVGTMRGPL